MSNKTNTILLVDAGNSAVKWVSHHEIGMQQMKTAYYADNISEQFFIELWQTIERPGQVMVSCVANDTTWQAMQAAILSLWNIKAHRVVADEKGHGILNAYDNVESMGSDRWCAMIAAYSMAKGACMVVSAGSALTVDIINQQGQHLGGYIVPGLSMMRQGLASNTAKVKPLADDELPVSLSPGDSTAACVESGIHLTAISLIEAVYEKQSQVEQPLHCYFSGGNAKVLAGLVNINVDIVPDLVLRGLAMQSFERDA